MKTLLCVSTYDRPGLLANLVQSLEVFTDAPILIVDNGSRTRAQHAYLQLIASSEKIRVLYRDRGRDALGGLYHGMNAALEVAGRERYEAVAFLQDDMQVLWQDRDFWSRAALLFENQPDAVQVAPIFNRLAQRARISSMDFFQESKSRRVRSYGLFDVGIVNMALFRRFQFSYKSTEEENSAFWRQRGFSPYLTLPSLAWVPWPETHRGATTHGAIRDAGSGLLLRPLDTLTRQRLIGSDQTDILSHEDYCIPEGWRALSPYWFTQLSREYFRQAGRTCLAERYSPRYLGDAGPRVPTVGALAGWCLRRLMARASKY